MAKRKCLIIERHEWETGAFSHQLQFPLAIANAFFGSGSADREVKVRVFLPLAASTPAFTHELTISRKYAKSSTRRANRFPQLGALPSAFLFFQETKNAGVYDFWWQTDKAIVAARYSHWTQAKASQYGRGRLAIIVAAPVPRPIKSL